jgi:hypothetical protein
LVCIGVDPGLTGGLAWLGKSVSSLPIPVKRLEGIRYPLLDHEKVNTWFEECSSTFQESPDVVILEDVHSLPRDSNQGAFTFGFTTGSILSYFSALDIPIVTIPPREWQKALLTEDVQYYSQDPSLTSREVIKASSIRYVKRRFPSLSLLPTSRSKKDHSGMADSICLALHGSMKLGRL